MRPARAIAVAALWAASLASAHVIAAPRVVILVRDPTDSDATRFESRLRSELLAAGFEVLSVPDPSEVGPDMLEAVAVRTQSVASIAVERPVGSVSATVWVSEQVTGKTLVRKVRPENVSPDAPSVFALRAVELLRASLLELNEPHPARGSVPAPDRVRQWVSPPVPSPGASSGAPRPAPALGLLAGAAALGGPGGVPPGVGPAIGALWRFAPRWAAEARFAGPVFGSVSGEEGSAALDQELLAAHLRFEMTSPGQPLVPFASLGAGAFRLGGSGRAPNPQAARSDAAWSPVVLLAEGLRVRAGEALGLTLELQTFVATSRPVVRLGDTTALYAGRPMFAGTLGLDYAW
jgi:hypothetical protein